MIPCKARFIIIFVKTSIVCGWCMGCDEYRKQNHNKLSLVVFATNLAIKNSFNNVFRWQRHFEEKMEAICNFFSLLAFCPFYPTADLLPDHELREVLQSKKITILGARVLGTSSNHRRRSRRGGEGHEGSSGSRPQPHHFPAQLWKLQTVQGKNLKIKAIFLTFQMWYYSRL